MSHYCEHWPSCLEFAVVFSAWPDGRCLWVFGRGDTAAAVCCSGQPWASPSRGGSPAWRCVCFFHWILLHHHQTSGALLKCCSSQHPYPQPYPGLFHPCSACPTIPTPSHTQACSTPWCSSQHPYCLSGTVCLAKWGHYTHSSFRLSLISHVFKLPYWQCACAS